MNLLRWLFRLLFPKKANKEPYPKGTLITYIAPIRDKETGVVKKVRVTAKVITYNDHVLLVDAIGYTPVSGSEYFEIAKNDPSIIVL